MPAGLLLLLLLIVLAVPFRVPFVFRSSGMIYPVTQWQLITDADGNYQAILRDYHKGSVVQQMSYRFERGDIASIQLNPHLEQVVRQHDTIGWLTSRLQEEQLLKTTNMLELEKRKLIAALAPERKAVLDGVQAEIYRLEENLNLASMQLERNKVLHADSLIADQELEIILNDYQQAKRMLEAAQSDYQAAMMSSKPEEIEQINATIFALEQELEHLQQTNKRYTLVSPISGKSSYSFYPSEITEYIRIFDTSNYIVYAAVKHHFLPYLNKNLALNFVIEDNETTLNARIFEISSNVENILGQKVIFVKAVVDEPQKIQLSGLPVQCNFRGDDISLREYFKRSLQLYLQ